MKVADLYPLTPLQEGMLFHALHDGAYVERLSARVHGLDVERFRAAWRTVVAAHPALRTAFAWTGSERPLQAVMDDVRVEVSTEPGPEPEFALDRAPLMRLALTDHGDGSDTFVWTHHHLLLDGWSVAHVLADVERAYHGRPLPARRPFREFVEWSARRPFAAAFWREALAGFAEPTPLPFGARAGGGPHATLWTTLACGVAAAARRLRVSAGSLVQSAWALVLARHSGVDDVLFGAVVSGRSPELPGANDMVGLLINTLPVRVRVDPEARVADWVRARHAEDARLRDLESTALIDVQRLTTVTPLLETLFVYESYPHADRSGLAIAGLPTTDLRIDERSNVPLTVAVVAGEPLRLGITYDTTAFDAAQIRALAEEFEAALAGLAGDPTARVGGLGRTLAPAPGPTLAFPDATVHACFEAQADRQPDAVAVRCGDASLTYGQLERRANRLAHRLIAQGAGPERLVGVCVERSVELVVALLAVLKTGAGYVPVDPAYPPARRALMQEATVLVVDCVEDAPGDDIRPERRGGPRSLAYVIYTSGSTGGPKGVAVEHRSVVARTADRRLLDVGPGETFLATAPVVFDVSAIELWGTLAQGATLVLTREDELTVEGIERLVREHSITALWLSAGVFRVVAEEQPRALAGVRRLIAGGEAVSLAAARAFLATGDGELVNGYGPTEATIFSVSAVLDGAAIAGGAVPIGSAIGNTRAYVLDAHLRPARVGQLCLAGVGVARGYLGCPGLTAERFVPDPFAVGERMYLTGDRVRLRADGTLDFLGRDDDQVKVRGHRVELGEVEAALAAQPGVGSALVVLRDERLAGYVTPVTADPDTLREALRAQLPEYMVPATILALDRWPLTRNGKIDRAALPATAAPVPAPVAPRNAFERELAALWAETLGVDSVGVRDNFFDCGGDSITAMRLIARIKRRLAVDVSVRELLAAQTVEELVPTVAERLRTTLAR